MMKRLLVLIIIVMSAFSFGCEQQKTTQKLKAEQWFSKICMDGVVYWHGSHYMEWGGQEALSVAFNADGSVQTCLEAESQTYLETQE